MATSLIQHETPRTLSFGQIAFVGVTLAIAVVSCALAGWAPLGFSIATVFLFAGPHNWFEGRYMLSRMPARWGPLKAYFLVGLCGVPTLVALYVGLAWFVQAGNLGRDVWLSLLATWNTLLIGWVATLAWMRSRQPPRRDWNWVIPIALLLIAANWMWPLAWSLGLVYLHPLLALWFLDRELIRRRKSWSTTYRCCLCVVPALLGLLWWNLSATPNLPGEDILSLQITRHAGGSILSGVSTHLLVATHTFLEMLHYGVWILAIPLLSVGAWPWQLDRVPLAKQSALWSRVLFAVVLLGAAIMIVLWAGFWADYPLTRNVYFTVAMLHVLAEFPFLLRLL